MTKQRRLREILRQPRLFAAGGAHDALSAKLVQRAGFELCVVTGGGVSMCRGYPDVGLLSMEETVANARYVAQAVDIPLIVDADDGYGNAINVMRTVRALEQAGVAGLHIEDQVWPKRCGHMFGKRLVPKGEMVQKIRAALDARHDPDLTVIARCDALMVEGLEASLDRGEAYLEAGADMLFFEMRESIEEIEAIAGRFARRVPLLFNNSVSGMVPRLEFAEIERLGFRIVAFYAHALLAASKAMYAVLSEIRRTGNAASSWDNMMRLDEFWSVGGLPEIRELEKKYATA